MTHQYLVIGLFVLAGIGVLAGLGYARSASRRATRGLRQVTRATSGVIRTLVAAGVITGLQWVIATYVHDWRVLIAVLAVPGLLAGRTVARMVAVTEFVSTKGRGWR